MCHSYASPATIVCFNVLISVLSVSLRVVVHGAEVTICRKFANESHKNEVDKIQGTNSEDLEYMSESKQFQCLEKHVISQLS